MAEKKLLRCKYAGDPEDEGCAGCDGLVVIDEKGDKFAADICAGYEPVEEEEIVENTQEELAPAPNSAPEAKEPAESCESRAESCENADDVREPVMGVTSVIRADSGVSREVNGVWYKFLFSEERILPDGCDIEKEKQDLWNSVNAEVDAQVDAVRN